MDYMQLIRKSVSNAWSYKFLWLFGFFVSVADGFGGGHWWTDKLDRCDNVIHLGKYGNLEIEPALLVFFAMVVFSLWIIFWVMSVLSEGSLIHGISRKELNLHVTFADCWSMGVRRFLRLFGIMLLATIVVISAILGLLLFIIPSYFASVALGISLTILAIPILLVIIVATICVEGWAIRFAILNDNNWLDAIGKGWRLFTTNVGKTLGVAFSSFFAQIILWCVLVVGMLILAIPLIVTGMVNLWLGIIPGVLLVSLVIILSSAFFGTFASSVWTIGFMQVTGYGQPQPVPATDVVPPATDSGSSLSG